MMVQLVIVAVVSVLGVMIWAMFGRRARLLRRARRAAQRAFNEARAEGMPLRDFDVWGSVDVSPGALAVVYYLPEDAMLAAAEASGAVARLQSRTLALLIEEKYP